LGRSNLNIASIFGVIQLQNVLSSKIIVSLRNYISNKTVLFEEIRFLREREAIEKTKERKSMSNQ
jgi:hypothetical protein